MRVRVKGENVPENILGKYVDELLKAHPDKDIRAVDIIVKGDYLKIKMIHDLDQTA